MDPVTLPARRDDTGSALDPYERAYMQPTGGAIRQRTAVPGRTFATLGVITTVVAVLSASWKLAIVGAMLFTWLLFAVLRVQVEADALVVHFGWKRRRIPLASITEVRVTRYSIAEGMGAPWLRRTARGLLFAVPGSGGDAVAVTFGDARGGSQTWILASRDAVGLRDAILARRGASDEVARAALPAGG